MNVIPKGSILFKEMENMLKLELDQIGIEKKSENEFNISVVASSKVDYVNINIQVVDKLND